jgi:hypothetical protein
MFAGVLRSELLRQWRAAGLNSALNDKEIGAIVRAVQLALAHPSPEMLHAGWGHHLNLTAKLGVEFATDDYHRLIAAAFNDDGSERGETHHRLGLPGSG